MLSCERAHTHGLPHLLHDPRPRWSCVCACVCVSPSDCRDTSAELHLSLPAPVCVCVCVVLKKCPGFTSLLPFMTLQRVFVFASVSRFLSLRLSPRLPSPSLCLSLKANSIFISPAGRDRLLKPAPTPFSSLVSFPSSTLCVLVSRRGRTHTAVSMSRSD